MNIGFDNQKYLQMQSAHIRERISMFGDKLYLEFGGKLFDDYHAARVLPGFEPDSKLKMLLQLKDQAEIVIAISASALETNKTRRDLGLTYDLEVLRLTEAFRNIGLYVGSVVITQYAGQPAADLFRKKLETLGIRCYIHYIIEGYPTNVEKIVSEEGYGKNDYIETSRPLVVVTAPGPGSGKMATCLSQLYHEHLRGVNAGYAKFETFPIWNLPLKHPVNLAYEAATADLNDVNMIDPFHLEAYGVTTVNYNMAGNCIIDDEACKEASRQEIIRRYYNCLCDLKRGNSTPAVLYKLELLMKQAGITVADRKVIAAAMNREEATGAPAAAIELPDGTLVTGKTSDLLGASAACLLNALKILAGIDHEIHLVSPDAIHPIQTLKINYLGSQNPRLHTDEILIALSISAATSPDAARALNAVPLLKGCEVHSSVLLSSVDEGIFKKLGMHLTCEPKNEEKDVKKQ